MSTSGHTPPTTALVPADTRTGEPAAAQPPPRPESEARPPSPRPGDTGLTVGYIRVSFLQPPAGGESADERRRRQERARDVRQAELAADAARDGMTVDAWYVDLNRSGRRADTSDREAMTRLCEDARAGRVRRVYARDLSRLFRDLLQQELWFSEMEGLGVEVFAQDLPHATDDSTRRLIRQQMGAIHEYQSARHGAVIRAVLREQVKAGQWVGRTASRWGLRYDHDAKAYGLDPDTAGKIRAVFEAFVEAGGVAGAAATLLNRRVMDGAEGATRSPWGAEWRPETVLYQVRCPLYRRRVVYEDLDIPAPALIPEVLPPGLVAQADRLLEERQPVYDAMAAWHRAARGAREPYTFTGLLRCAACGRLMRVVRSSDADGHEEDRWASWRCEASHGRGVCTSPFAARQVRVDALAGQCLALAFSGYAGRYTPPPGGSPTGGGAAGRMDVSPAALLPGLEAHMGRLARRRDRYLELYASGMLADAEALRPHLERLDREADYLRARAESVRAEAGAEAALLGRETFAQLREAYEAAWAVPPEPLRDRGKREFLLAAGVALRVTFHQREPKGARAPDNLRRYGGTLTLTLEMPRLGLTGEHAVSVTEAAAPVTPRGVPSPRRTADLIPPAGEKRRGEERDGTGQDGEGAGDEACDTE